MGTLSVNTITPSTGSTVTIPAFVPAGQFSLRNKIINGKMDIAQRGTSFAAIAHDAYSLDRWQWQQNGTGVGTMSQQADAPSNNEFQNSLRYAVTTADASIAATDVYSVREIIEGYNVRDLIGKTFTLSFWVRSSKTGTHCVSFVNSGGDRSYVAEYTVNAANTWEQKTITVSGGLITAGTWNWTNGAGLRVGWALAAGTNFQTTAGAWQTGNYLATANQVNCLDSNTNIFAITGVQLEVGAVATPFEHRPIGTELALCQRYYQKSFNQGTAPAQNAGTVGAVYVPQTVGASTSVALTFIRFPVAMRTTPTTVTLYNPIAANALIRNTSTGADWVSSQVTNQGDAGFGVAGTTAAGSGTGNTNQFHWSSEAEL